jgi:hypothetical protein
MSKNRLLKDAFQYVRKTFFPNWDRKKEWRVYYLPQFKTEYDRSRDKFFKEIGIAHLMGKSDVIGECIEDLKYIYIYEIPDDLDALHELLIHEICHIKASGHGKRWMENMDRVFVKAQRNPKISSDLIASIESDILDQYDERLL